MADQWPARAPGAHHDARDDVSRPITLDEIEAVLAVIRQRRVLPTPAIDPALRPTPAYVGRHRKEELS